MWLVVSPSLHKIRIILIHYFNLLVKIILSIKVISLIKIVINQNYFIN
jgi:hypothetical protein